MNPFFKNMFTDNGYKEEVIPRDERPRNIPEGKMAQTFPADVGGVLESSPLGGVGPQGMPQVGPRVDDTPLSDDEIERQIAELEAELGMQESDEKYKEGLQTSYDEGDYGPPTGMAVNQAVGTIKPTELTLEDEMFNAISEAETGGVVNPWIRTEASGAPGGSSAFGPAQITTDLMKRYKKNHSNLFDKEEVKFIDRFIKQGKEFLKYGNEPNKKGYDTKWDYGGTGDLIQSEEDKEMYNNVATKMLRQHLKDAKGDVEEATRVWRYGPKDKGKVDNRYYEVVSNAMGIPNFQGAKKNTDLFDSPRARNQFGQKVAPIATGVMGGSMPARLAP